MADLSDFIVSKVRVKLLKIFFSNPKEMYHVRGLVRSLEEEINAVRRELARMEEVGLVKKENRGNRLYYFLRPDYEFYQEILALVAKTAGLGEAIIKNRTKLGKIWFVMFSGRFVRRKPRKESDEVDLLVVGEVELGALASIIRAEEAKREEEINYTVMTKEEFDFRKKRRDPFLLEVLSSERIMIIGNEDELIG